ncbi:hypothetical protein BDZ90DRAFT_258080 [Jaminaea rosea]|uniref:GH16 domain-containing protein n=1 Tax=Jaminaea rosea TaxID=1569628 RepID=A0A316V0G3_9BASI|nr:hypothetical protein BDZ90DRAFT_258080 [Jaminaea rosea]PWN31036.1 hypothetical protein BDZ90DRAFT_258080 [Jaminaea rosea]
MTHSYQSVGNGHPTPSGFSSSPVPPASESKSSSSSVSSSTYTTLALTSSTRSTNGHPVPARFSTSSLRAVSETTSPTVHSSSLQQPSSTHRAPSSTTATRSTVSVPQASSKGISATSSTHTTGSTSSRAPHPSPPGQQPCRSSHWDFRSLPRSSIISNWDTTSAAASLADFIDLSGTPAGTTWALTSQGLELYLVKPKESGTAALAATMSTTFVLKMGAKVTAEMQTSGVGGAVSTLTMYHPGQDEIDIELPGGVCNTNYFVGGKGQSGTGWESSKLDGSETSDGFHSYSYAWDDEVIRFGFDGATVHDSRRVKNASFWPTHGQT